MHYKCDRLNKALAGGNTDAIISAMRSLRKTVDAMENLVADDHWPLPKYREMLFVY